MQIAIDGPAGAGKSSIAKKLSKRLGFLYLDTGAMFRAVALYLSNENISPSEHDKITSVLPNIALDIKFIDGLQRVFLNDVDVTGDIRSESVSVMVSKIAVIPEVRQKLLNMQRVIASKQDIIMDGRDIGSTVLPNADLKIYLTASANTRAVRRLKQLTASGADPRELSLKQIEADIIERDERDSTRQTAPLIIADDAKVIDTSDMDFEESLNAILALIPPSAIKADDGCLKTARPSEA